MDRTISILVADDDQSIRELFMWMFPEGTGIITAKNPDEVLEIIEEGQQRIDFAYFDVNYAGYKMNGFDLARTLKKSSHHVPFFIMSFDDSVENRILAKEVGAQAFLYKSHEELMASVKIMDKPY